jgi:hypothetical protein
MPSFQSFYSSSIRVAEINLFVFYDAVNIPNYSIEWEADWWIMNWKGFGRTRLWPVRGTVLPFAWMDWGKPRKPPSQDNQCPRPTFETSTSLIQVWQSAPRLSPCTSGVHFSPVFILLFWVLPLGRVLIVCWVDAVLANLSASSFHSRPTYGDICWKVLEISLYIFRGLLYDIFSIQALPGEWWMQRYPWTSLIKHPSVKTYGEVKV